MKKRLNENVSVHSKTRWRFFSNAKLLKNSNSCFVVVTQNLLEKYIMQVNNRNISLICLTFFKLAIKTPNTVWKVSKYVVFSGPYFLVFGLNTERYPVSLRIQFKCGKIRTRKNYVSGHFSHSVSDINVHIISF